MRHYEGTDQSGVFQQRTLKYDGHGRLSSRTTPEQGECTYTYHADDTLHVMTDARGATHTHAYTPRHFANSITYGVPAGVAPTGNVTFAYDAGGNRTQMADGQGAATYHYDSLGRMDWEERTLGGLGPFRLTYGYNNAGLTSVTDPSQFGGAGVSYPVDHTGARTGVYGSGPWNHSVYSHTILYRATGGVKSETYGNGRVLSVEYDKLMRLSEWGVSGVQGWKYSYSEFGENTGRVTYAQNTFESGPQQADPSLDHSYDYDGVGRLLNSYTGTEARAHAGRAGGAWGVHDGPYSQAYLKDVWGNVTRKWGRAGDPDQFIATYTNNKRDGFTYDASGNLTFDGGQSFTYDATGQQATASYPGYSLQQAYDGDRLRVRKAENGQTTYYLRSSVLGGQVVAEFAASGAWQRGYVYGAGGGLMAMRMPGSVPWVYQDPVTKTQRMADSAGNVMAGVDTDPWGRETARGWNQGQFPRRYTTYERDGNQSDEAMMRRYNRWHLRFDQPDPYDGSYDLSDPQSFNRYSYTNNDPVNFVDPTGLIYQMPDATQGWSYFAYAFWGYAGSGGRLTTRIFGHVKNSHTDDPSEWKMWWGAVFTWEPWGGAKGSDKYIKDFYKNFKADIERCAKQVFKEDYEKIKDRLGADKRPAVNSTGFTQKDLERWTDETDAAATPLHLAGKYGTIVIARELFSKMSDRGKQAVFAHELGNLLSMVLTRGDAYKYGDPNGIQGDKDTGAKFEECIFGQLIPLF